MTEIRPVLYVVVIPDAIDGRTGKRKRLSAQLRIGSDPTVEFGLQFYAFLGTGFRRPDPTVYGIDQFYALRDRGGFGPILIGSGKPASISNVSPSLNASPLLVTVTV